MESIFSNKEVQAALQAKDKALDDQKKMLKRKHTRAEEEHHKKKVEQALRDYLDVLVKISQQMREDDLMSKDWAQETQEDDLMSKDGAQETQEDDLMSKDWASWHWTVFYLMIFWLSFLCARGLHRHGMPNQMVDTTLLWSSFHSKTSAVPSFNWEEITTTSFPSFNWGGNTTWT